MQVGLQFQLGKLYVTWLVESNMEDASLTCLINCSWIHTYNNTIIKYDLCLSIVSAV
jgi:hypothetical protein